MRFLLVAFSLAAVVGFAAGRWDGQFVANTAGSSSLTASSGADGCTAIPKNGAYLHVTSINDAYVGIGVLNPDGGSPLIGTSAGPNGGGCKDNDAGVACDPVYFSQGAASFIQAAPNSNRICVRAMDGGNVTVGIGVCQN